MFTNDYNLQVDKLSYESGDRFTDERLAKGEARAIELYNNLVRWQIKNDKAVDVYDIVTPKYSILYDYSDNKLTYFEKHYFLKFLDIPFSSAEKCEQAIKVFKDELIWFFTEYKTR